MTHGEEQDQRRRGEHPGLGRSEMAEVHDAGGEREEEGGHDGRRRSAPGGREAEQQDRDRTDERREGARGEEGIGPGRRQRAEDGLLDGYHRGRESEGEGGVDVGIGQEPSLPHHRGHHVGLFVGVEARGEAPADAGEVQGEGEGGDGEEEAALGHAPLGRLV
jgi:hypothetical protein